MTASQYHAFNSPCDSEFWQLQSDRYMACFRGIKTRGMCVFAPFSRHGCLVVLHVDVG